MLQPSLTASRHEASATSPRDRATRSGSRPSQPSDALRSVPKSCGHPVRTCLRSYERAPSRSRINAARTVWTLAGVSDVGCGHRTMHDSRSRFDTNEAARE